MKATIKINKGLIDPSVLKIDKTESIEISHAEIFKFGIFKHEVPPDHVRETDFEYLMSKVPSYESLYSDFIELRANQIINKSQDDRIKKDISEVVGIALGLKLTVTALGIQQSQIEKIPPPLVKEKYLDYKFTHNNHSYEIETKGTIQDNVNKFVEDIKAKIKNKPAIHYRYGTIAQINNSGSKRDSILHLCNDPPKEIPSQDDRNSSFRHYLSPLSFIFDNRSYNKLIKFHAGTTRRPIKFSTELFFGKYVFQGEEYLGDFFDRRLIQESLLPLAKETKSIDKLFAAVTKRQGKHKIFIGINIRILKMLFNNRSSELSKIQFDEVLQEHSKSVIFRDTDGILIAKSKGEADSQISNAFTEDEVKRRIGYYGSFLNRSPTNCDAPCRSRQLQGKSCEIKTYRGRCHYHR